MTQTLSANAKTATLTALVSAAATVLTAFIGIVPQMRRGDQTKIEELTKQVAALQQQLSIEVYRVSGRVKSRNNTPITNAVLYVAMPESASLDDNGRFVFENMLRKPYCIVLATQNGTMRRVLINPDDPEPESDLPELAITYGYSKK